MRVRFEINDDKYVIEEIKIKDYYKIKTNLMLEGREAEFQIVSNLSGCPIKDLKKIPLDDWEEISFGLEMILRIAFKERIKMVKSFKYEDVEYGLIDMNKMTVGEFSDLDVIVSSTTMEYKLHEIVAILYRPIIGKKWGKPVLEEYDYDGFKHRSNLFLNIDLSIAQSILGFFLTSAQASIKVMKTFSKMTEEMRSQVEATERMISLLQGNGTTSSLTWLEKIRLKSTRLQNWGSEKHLTSLLINRISLKNFKKWIVRWIKNIKK